MPPYSAVPPGSTYESFNPQLSPGSTICASRACGTDRSFKSWVRWLEGTVSTLKFLEIHHLGKVTTIVTDRNIIRWQTTIESIE